MPLLWDVLIPWEQTQYLCHGCLLRQHCPGQVWNNGNPWQNSSLLSWVLAQLHLYFMGCFCYPCGRAAEAQMSSSNNCQNLPGWKSPPFWGCGSGPWVPMGAAAALLVVGKEDKPWSHPGRSLDVLCVPENNLEMRAWIVLGIVSSFYGDCAWFYSIIFL